MRKKITASVLTSLEMARITLKHIPAEFKLGSAWRLVVPDGPHLDQTTLVVTLKIHLVGREDPIEVKCGMDTGRFVSSNEGYCVVLDGYGLTWTLRFDLAGDVIKPVMPLRDSFSTLPQAPRL